MIHMLGVSDLVDFSSFASLTAYNCACCYFVLNKYNAIDWWIGLSELNWIHLLWSLSSLKQVLSPSFKNELYTSNIVASTWVVRSTFLCFFAFLAEPNMLQAVHLRKRMCRPTKCRLGLQEIRCDWNRSLQSRWYYLYLRNLPLFISTQLKTKYW